MSYTVTWDGGFLRIHDSKIHLFGYRGGALYRMVQSVTRSGARFASIRAPKRSGELAASISIRNPVYSKVNRRATAYFSATAPHAQAVIFGTLDANIVPKNGKFMRLRAGGGYPVSFQRRVRGQAPNDFMQDALNAAIALHVGRGVSLT